MHTLVGSTLLLYCRCSGSSQGFQIGLPRNLNWFFLTEPILFRQEFFFLKLKFEPSSTWRDNEIASLSFSVTLMAEWWFSKNQYWWLRIKSVLFWKRPKCWLLFWSRGNDDCRLAVLFVCKQTWISWWPSHSSVMSALDPM